MSALKSSEVKKLIGQNVQWKRVLCANRGSYRAHAGKLLDIKGKNILIDQGGSHDWLWLPDLTDLEIAITEPLQKITIKSRETL